MLHIMWNSTNEYESLVKFMTAAKFLQEVDTVAAEGI